MSATITKDMLRFAVRAYRQLKDVPADQHPASVVYESRHGEEASLEHMMFRRHWYYGEWAYFERGYFACRFAATLLADMMVKEDEAKAAKLETPPAADHSEPTP